MRVSDPLEERSTPTKTKNLLFLSRCKGNYYGRQCELDGEVVAVAIGASVAAVVIIVLTLTCLCLWSRRWKRDHRKAEMMMSFPPYILPGETTATKFLPRETLPNVGLPLEQGAPRTRLLCRPRPRPTTWRI